jgi:hypothetical protein
LPRLGVDVTHDVIDALTFSSVWVAIAATALAMAASDALHVPIAGRLLTFVFAGTILVYQIDRLRDLARDRETAPLRTAFVERHRGALQATIVMAAIVALVCLPAIGRRGAAIASIVLALGLLHRRLKRVWFVKPLYLTIAWLLATVGLPVAAADGGVPDGLGWTVVVLGAALFANVLASGVRDHEATAARLGTGRTLAIARTVASLGVAAGVLASPAIRPLACVPLATLAAVIAFRAGERYGLTVVDGALVVGAVAALMA